TFLTPHLLSRASDLQAALGVSNMVEPWIQEWHRQDPLRELAQAALTQAPRRVPPSTNTALLGLMPPLPPLPALFWFHALDRSSPPQSMSWLLRRDPWKGASRDKNLFSAASFSALPLETTPRSPSEKGASELPTVERYWLASRLEDSAGVHWLVCRALGIWG